MFNTIVTLTLRRTLVLVIPHHQQLSQARHLRNFSDDPEKTLNAIVGQHHCSEPRGSRWDEWQEQRAVHTGPLLHEMGNKERVFRPQTSSFSSIPFHFCGKLL